MRPRHFTDAGDAARDRAGLLMMSIFERCRPERSAAESRDPVDLPLSCLHGISRLHSE